jgi:hypothetical protein
MLGGGRRQEATSPFKATIQVDTIEKGTFACPVSCYAPTSGAWKKAT